MKNLLEAAERIKKAIEKEENIILYADSDLDGVASTLILEETILNLGGRVSAVYFPDREEEGYGINEKALNYLSKFAPGLFIALDCGISNFEEIKKAVNLGFYVIIIDHHEILEKLPEAQIIVNPKQEDDPYHFKFFATAGIVYKLAEVLLNKNPNKNLFNNFLELVALATLADLMPETNENKEFIRKGLESLENSWRPAFKIFFQEREENWTSTRMIAHKIISTLQAAKVENHLNEAYLFLKETDEEKLRSKKNYFFDLTLQRQKQIREILQEVEKIVVKKIQEPIIFEGNSNWPIHLIGAIATRLCNKFGKIAFIFKIKDKESVGAMRAPANIDGVFLMKKAAQFLESFGGHPQAGGFRIKNENLEKFKNCLVENFKNYFQ